MNIYNKKQQVKKKSNTERLSELQAKVKYLESMIGVLLERVEFEEKPLEGGTILYNNGSKIVYADPTGIYQQTANV